MKQIVALWLERAEYDWETATVMMSSRRYLYVAFMCQQAIEKILKGVIQRETDKLPPYTHNLVALTENCSVRFSEEQLDFLALLTRYYLNTRYPDYKQKLAKEINKGKADELLKKTKEIYQCLKKKLKT